MKPESLDLSGVLGASFLSDAYQPPAAGGSGPSAPLTPIEQAIAEIWQAVLASEQIDFDASFFEQGGDSLLATQVVARVRQLLGVELALEDLFETPTIAGMAQRAEAALQGAPAPALPPLTPAPRAGPLPISFTQERMWFIQNLDPTSAAYNVVTGIRLTGPLYLAALQSAFTQLIAHHESLRTTFVVDNGQPTQVIAATPIKASPQSQGHPSPSGARVGEEGELQLQTSPNSIPTSFSLSLIPIEGVTAEARLSQALTLAQQTARQPFDLAHGPLWRAALYTLDPHDHILLLSQHHIISDAWSLALFVRDLFACYTALVQGQSPTLPALPVQPADFAVWQREWLQGEALAYQLDYWRRQLAGLAPLVLPSDRPRPAVQSFRGATASIPLEADLLAGLRRYSQTAGVTLSMTLLAAYQALLHRHCGQTDIAVGLPIANRRWLATENLLGAFVNTLVLRSDLAGDPTFAELLGRVRRTALDAYAHQDMPFARLVTALNPERSLSRPPLVQVMFNHINVPMPAIQPAGLTGSPVEVERGAAQCDLLLTVIDLPQLHQLQLEYSTDLFDRASIDRLLANYIQLLSSLLAEPAAPISRLRLLGDADVQQIVQDWNATHRHYPLDQGLHHVFEAQARRAPEAVALIDGGQALTAGDLNRQANQLARHLQTLGVAPGSRVALCLPRSLDQIVCLLAILKAGAAYVPLDPAYPAERLTYMLADSQAALVITSASTAAHWPQSGPRRLLLESVREQIALESGANLELEMSGESPAYLIYTSGSSGRPKGVLAPHRGALNAVYWMWDAYPFAPGEVACHKTSLSFVDSVGEIFRPLLAGVPLVLLPEEEAKDPETLVAALAAHSITRVVLVPSLLRALLNLPGSLAERLPALRGWAASGEQLDLDLAEAFHRQLPDAVLLNLYGSSEVAADVTCFDTCQPASHWGVPIGRPLANTRIYVLDAHQQPAPIGVTGEIYVGGAGVALGYWNQPALTAERFVPDPFGSQPGARLYRTGDLGRFLPDGNLLYQGRADRQVKLRGVRIELDEIAAVLRQHPAIAEAAVVVRDDALAAFVVASAAGAKPTDELRAFLRQCLPAAMLPSALVWLAALPHLPNGKLDSSALPALDPDRAAQAPDYVAPRNELEAALAALWAEALGLSRVGVTDDFFELGGHSLLAASLLTRLEALAGRPVALTAFFQTPTIAGLVAGLAQPAAPAPARALVAIQPHGARPPFFCVHPLGGGVADYAALAHHLPPDQPFYGLRAPGLDDAAQHGLSLEAMASGYLREVQALQSAGPYHLGGYSSGGLIAYEMACQLAEAGQPVSLLALIDTTAPPTNGRGLRPEQAASFLANLPNWLRDFAGLGTEEILARLRRRLAPAGPLPAEILAGDVAALPERHQRFIEAHYAAILAYRPRPYAGRATLLRAQIQALSSAAAPDKGWGTLALGGVDILDFSGSHRTLFAEPHAASLAGRLAEALAAAA